MKHPLSEMEPNELYTAMEFIAKEPEKALKVIEILQAIGGGWDFAYYHFDTDVGFWCVCYVDAENEDRTFFMEWNGEDRPFEKANITVAID